MGSTKPWLGLAVALSACAQAQGPDQRHAPGSPAPSPAPSRTIEDPDPCAPQGDRPAMGESVVESASDPLGVRVRYSAALRSPPCGTLDILFVMRDGMLIGDPSSQVELVWRVAREIPDDAVHLALVHGSSTVALATEVDRSGPQASLSARATARALAMYASEARPAFLIAGRRAELSRRQTRDLHDFLRRLPLFVAPPRRSSGGAAAAAPARPVAEQMDGPGASGWFCVEAASPERPGRAQTSSCHLTRTDCDDARSSFSRSGLQPTGDCFSTPTAACYRWRTAAASGRSCFVRPSHCKRDKVARGDAGADFKATESCAPVR